MDLRLVSYNVHCFPWFSTPIREIVDWVTANADVVALQEVWCRHAMWSTAFAAKGWTFLRPSRENHIAGVFGSGLAVAWRSSYWTLTDARLYPYLSAVGIDSLVTKGWFHVDLKARENGMPLRLLNTHMQADYDVCDELWRPIAEPVRMAQAFQLIEVESRLPSVPTLIVGDMNTEMCWFPECRWLTHHAGPTFSGTSQVIDHCASWVSQKWDVITHRVGRECNEWSDHWPVLWSLRLRAFDKGPLHQYPAALRPSMTVGVAPHLHRRAK